MSQLLLLFLSLIGILIISSAWDRRLLHFIFLHTGSPWVVLFPFITWIPPFHKLLKLPKTLSLFPAHFVSQSLFLELSNDKYCNLLKTGHNWPELEWEVWIVLIHRLFPWKTGKENASRIRWWSAVVKWNAWWGMGGSQRLAKLCQWRRGIDVIYLRGLHRVNL